MPDVRSELSKKNYYYIPKERYLELKHFCAQVPDWMMEHAMLKQQRFDTGLRIIFNSDGTVRTNHVNRPTEIPDATEREIILKSRIDHYKEALFSAWPEEYNSLLDYFQMAIWDNESYDKLCARYPKLSIVPRYIWYGCYRKFFYILDKTRN